MKAFVAFGIVAVVAITAFATRELTQKPKPAAPFAAMCDMNCCKMMMMAKMSGGAGGQK